MQGAAAAAAPAPARAAGPMPPNMHWAAVLILGWITGGLVMLFWTFKEASFVRKIDPASKAFTMFAVSLVSMLGGLALLVVAIVLQSNTLMMGAGSLMMLLNLLIIVLGLVAVFGMRSSIERYYNMRLSPIMTFFFNILYFQYHFSRIAEGKK